MNQGQKIITVLVSIATITTIAVIFLLTISTRIYKKAQKIAEQNQCSLEIDYPSIGLGFPSEEYKCPQNLLLENELNSYIKQGDSWGWFGISIMVLAAYLIPIGILVSIFIYCIYQLVK